jgi:hypothetical protein
MNIDLKKWIIEEFGATEVICNSSVYSFDYKELQVDFILTPPKYWETSQVYYLLYYNKYL